MRPLRVRGFASARGRGFGKHRAVSGLRGAPCRAARGRRRDPARKSGACDASCCTHRGGRHAGGLRTRTPPGCGGAACGRPEARRLADRTSGRLRRGRPLRGRAAARRMGVPRRGGTDRRPRTPVQRPGGDIRGGGLRLSGAPRDLSRAVQGVRRRGQLGQAVPSQFPCFANGQAGWDVPIGIATPFA